MKRFTLLLLALVLTAVIASAATRRDFERMEGDDEDELPADFSEEESHNLLRFAREGNVEGVAESLAKGGFIDWREPASGQTALMAASLSGHVNVIKALLERGADRTRGEKDGYTPLHGAAFQGRADAALALLEAGFDPNDYHRDGFAPIHRACWGDTEGHRKTVDIFHSFGVAVRCPEKRRQLPK